MATVKLADGGPVVAFLVQKVTDDVSQTKGKKAQFKFSGRTESDPNAMIWLFTDTAERQFARIGLNRETIIGKWVEFSKTDQGYYDINLPNGASAPTAAPPVKAAPAPAPAVTASAPVDPDAVKAARKAGWERAKRCYAKCFDAALEIATAKLDKEGGWDIPLTHDGIAMMADSLFSHCKQEGVV